MSEDGDSHSKKEESGKRVKSESSPFQESKIKYVTRRNEDPDFEDD